MHCISHGLFHVSSSSCSLICTILILGGEAYKVKPGPVVAGDLVSSARFILLLLLLLALVCFHSHQFNNSCTRFELVCITLLYLSTTLPTAPISAARHSFVSFAARPLRSGFPAGVRSGLNKLPVPGNPKHFHTLHGKAPALCYPSTS